jgi:hypothetical protein
MPPPLPPLTLSFAVHEDCAGHSVASTVPLAMPAAPASSVAST